MDVHLPGRTAKEWMEEIRERAAAYVPEWRLDRENPDIGVALAEVYARLHSGIEQKYRMLPEKFGTDFFNCLNTSMRPSAPAGGYAVFGLSDPAADGAELPAGTSLLTDASDEYGERIPVETQEDVYVAPDTLELVAECSDREDYIGLPFDPAQGKTERSFPLFGREAENRQEHVFCIGHPYLLSLRRRGRISLAFLKRRGEPLEGELLRALANPGLASFFYETGEGEIPFDRVSVNPEGISLEKTGDMPPWEERELLGQRAYWLGCRIRRRDVFSRLSFEALYLASECPAMAPDFVYANGNEVLEGTYFPFGERPYAYGEVCFASDEALNKRGAMVELSFDLEFREIAIDAAPGDGEIRWKLVMPKEEARPEREYEISIEEVVWEYYNGFGWAALPLEKPSGDCFRPGKGRGRRRKSLRFICPDDMSPVLVSARESFYIRARILKMNNAFKTNGVYAAPMLSNTMLRYQYDSGRFLPWYLYRKNNMEQECLPAGRLMGDMRPFFPALGTGDAAGALYLGFRKKPERGPLRMLFVMAHEGSRKQPRLVWEYYGDGGWRPLHAADETESFSKTGTVTFAGCPDAARLSLFQRELYWIRIRDKDGGYVKNGIPRPELCGIYMNAARVKTVRTGLEERLTMEGYESQSSFRLLNRNIHRLEVWVMENGLYEEERQALKEEGRLEEIRDEDGRVRETWARWRETDQFAYHAPSERCYVLDANEGVLTFGGGRHGAIPAPNVPDGIRVRYSVGGGERCNLLAGQINGLEFSAGFINRAANPLALFGGYDRETAKEAMARAGRALGHGFQAVTAQDYISLAMETTRNIEKAACFSGVDANGARHPGAVTLVILKKDGSVDGRFFEEMRREILEGLRDRLPAGLPAEQAFFIREPAMVELELSVAAEAAGFRDIFAVRRGIGRALEEFLHPVSGNFNGRGWEIGTLPDPLQIETVIKAVPGVRLLKSCVIFARLGSEPGCPQTDLERIRKNPFVLPMSGKQKIEVLVSYD